MEAVGEEVSDINFANIRVLVVDDVQSARFAVKRALSYAGFKEIDEAKSGAEALNKLQNSVYQVVVTDWEMSQMDGLTLMKETRKLPKAANTAFIMVTGTASKEKVVEAIKAGASDYVVKPFGSQLLAEKVVGALERAAKNDSGGRKG